MIAGLVIVTLIGFVPIPQRISATAVLQPSQRKAYYAPVNGIVDEVLCGEGDRVATGQTLLRLSSSELTSEINATDGQLQRTLDRMREQKIVRDRGVNLSAQQMDRLEAEILQLGIESESLQKQLDVLQTQEQALTITALDSGQVATWDVRNRLLHRPVKAGDLLLATFEENGPWELQVSIPERRVGLIDQHSISEEPDVYFHLPSSPQETHCASLKTLSSTTITETTANGPQRFVLARASLSDLEQLPLRKDGALAQATIDCGQVSLGWLVFRDAYWALRSRIEMLW